MCFHINCYHIHNIEISQNKIKTQNRELNWKQTLYTKYKYLGYFANKYTNFNVHFILKIKNICF